MADLVADPELSRARPRKRKATAPGAREGKVSATEIAATGIVIAIGDRQRREWQERLAKRSAKARRGATTGRHIATIGHLVATTAIAGTHGPTAAIAAAATVAHRVIAATTSADATTGSTAPGQG